ncbi:MAG: nitrilase-related carbon-nitrogen hydrolase, partial [Verrucomicrobiota bacterium]
MKLLRVGAAILNQTPLAWDSNENHIAKALTEANAQNVSILCLPELCITGYGCEDAFHSTGTHEMAWKTLKRLLPQTKGMIVSFGLPIMYQNSLFNCAALAVDGELAGLVAKQHLAGDGIHYEPRWFKSWPSGVRKLFEKDGNEYPIGDLFFECGGIRIGFEICEDAWVAARPGAALAQQGVDVIMNPSASHFAFDKIRTRER